MPLYDFRCPQGHVTEALEKFETRTRPCLICDATAERVLLVAPKLDYGSMAQGESAGTTAIDKFERMHKQQRAKEEKSFAEHGDYGPRPGAD